MTIAPNAVPAAALQLVDGSLEDAVLRAVAGVTGMQVAFLASVDGATLRWTHVHGQLTGVTAGTVLALNETFSGRLLAGGPATTSNAGADPSYASTPLRTSLGITSYAGVPLRRNGAVVGTLGAMDTASVVVSPAQLRVLTTLARLFDGETFDAETGAVRLRRVAQGWEVESGDGSRETEPDLTVAMSLADLIAEDTVETVPAQRPERPAEDLGELDRLRLQVVQLEHALSARVVIEQAIGVLSQRHSLAPREAFDRMRTSARSRGQRVHELAVEVVRSACDTSVVLPAGLS